ncbi:MAG: LPS-assembly protein LptD [Candidatus Symbiothrix sp.]|jgi:hypothetical protein|nr:LPS-assembly protein LptD [Candidatus Symbiothrix sp.]
MKQMVALRLVYALLLVSALCCGQTMLAQSDTVAVQAPDTLGVIPPDTLVAAPPDTVAKKSNAVDAPVQYTAKDSMVMTMKDGNMLYLFGDGNVQYKDLNLTGEYIEVNADSSIVYATFAVDSIGEEYGYPVFKQGDTQYEMKKARYNFKSKKMFVTDVITQQGDGYVTASRTKKMGNDDLYMRDGKYTTCDDHEHPHFYLDLTRAKMRPKKNVVTGPAYLVVEDVPLPIAIPFGFFPFTDEYSSGILMPSYGDEMKRGFSLRGGGYYFAFNDFVDMAVTGDIYTKGSWGLNARSNYRKRYKFSGNVNVGYIVTVTGEKGEDDYSLARDFQLTWAHSQDAKANPFSTFSASVNFSTSSYSRNELSSLYSNQYTQNTKSSSINYTYRPPNSAFSFSANASINQISKDTTLSLTLPNFTVTMREVYPFQRKEQVGAPRWYENIRMSYTGLISNSIQNVKEYDFFKKNLIRDWRNGAKHSIPVSASFSLLKNITITPNITYNERWYTSRIEQEYSATQQRVAPKDTTYGFYRIYDFSGSISAQTKLYGMFQPWRMFGEWTKNTQIRHVLTPSVSFSGAPDFGDPDYGYYKDLVYINDKGEQVTYNYSPYSHNLWGVPSKGRSGSLNFSVDNNLEMKLPIANTDSTRKISLIDQLRVNMGYNFLADSMNWSDMTVSLRLKWFGKSALSLSGTFDTYTYNENGVRINVPRWQAGKGLGRLRGTGTSYSYTINNGSLKKLAALFSKNKKDDLPDDTSEEPAPDQSDIEAANAAAVETPGNETRASLRKPKEKDDNYDANGYYKATVPWNINLSYSLSMAYNMSAFDKKKREYPYKFSQTLGISGNIAPTKNWNITFNTSYDFDYKRFATMQCSITRQMHCWSMSASVIPIGPYQSYNFTIAVSSSMLQDLKYNQSSSYYDAMRWE